jgi:hypothetical protein
VETLFYYHHICNFSGDALAPVTSWRPGQLPGWPNLILALVAMLLNAAAEGILYLHLH